MTEKFVLRCRAHNGQHVLSNLTESSTFSEVKLKISTETGISVNALRILSGYPPKQLDIDDGNVVISSILKSGDTLTVQESKSSTVVNNAVTVNNTVAGCDSNLIQQMSKSSGILTRKVVPADNSCLFTSIHATLNNGHVNKTAASELRKIISDVVNADKSQFNAAFLGKSNRDYCDWIRKDSSWGGAIEIAILSDFFKVEIDVVDTQSARIDRFGEDKFHANRVLLLYDGIHYDPLVFDKCNGSSDVDTLFPVTNSFILAQAMELADEAKASKQFTNLAGFSLKCLVCSAPLVGQKEAQMHAQDTGHINFGEIK